MKVYSCIPYLVQSKYWYTPKNGMISRLQQINKKLAIFFYLFDKFKFLNRRFDTFFKLGDAVIVGLLSGLFNIKKEYLFPITKGWFQGIIISFRSNGIDTRIMLRFVIKKFPAEFSCFVYSHTVNVIVNYTKKRFKKNYARKNKLYYFRNKPLRFSRFYRKK
jgi:ribosomal protein L19